MLVPDLDFKDFLHRDQTINKMMKLKAKNKTHECQQQHEVIIGWYNRS